MQTRKVLAALVAAAGLYLVAPSAAQASPLGGGALGSLLDANPLMQDVRVFCYNRATGRFLHWGRCGSRYRPARARPRVYCYNRRTGRFLHWGACRR